MTLLLAIDIGNTQITLGAFRGATLMQTWRLHTFRHSTSDELGVQLQALLRGASLSADEISGIMIASVVPPLDVPIARACEAYLQRTPLLVGPETNLGIANRYKKPEEVGADRLVNAVAVHSLFSGPAIVVDFGTATTFDCVNSRGDYLGGSIAPGLAIAQDALAERTAKLPRITFEIPSRVMGKTTKESLQSGLFYGYISLVEGMLQRLVEELGGRPKVVATGGLSTVIGPRIKAIHRIEPDLMLTGLRILWERNRV